MAWLREPDPTCIWDVYLRRRVAYVPTVARVERGAYVDIDPVAVVRTENLEDLQVAIERAINAGNPPTILPKGGPRPVSPVLRHANVRSWAAFARELSFWQIRRVHDVFHVNLQRRSVKRGFEDDPAGCEALPPGVTVGEVARRVAERVAKTAAASCSN